MTALRSGEDGRVDDVYDDLLSSSHSWCLPGGRGGGLGVVEMENKGMYSLGTNRINRSSDENDNSDVALYRERRQDGMRNCGNCEIDLEGISETTLQAMWAQHLNDAQHDQTGTNINDRKRRHERHQSIASLEEQGVGSFNHLNMLSSEQLQSMHKMVEDHDDRYWKKRHSHNLIPLEWLDSLCS